jgi:acyl-CoA thioesterase FadM
VLLARAATDWAFIHFATGAPRRIPPEVSQAFETVPVE